MITKQEFESLYNPDIKKSDYNSIISKINDYFAEIIYLIKKPKNQEWFAFNNSSEEEGDGGYFDPIDYSVKISIRGTYSLPNPYDNQIPTRWVWTSKEDILKEYNEEVQKSIEEENKEKERIKQKNKERKEYRLALANQIRAKLTKEELKIITFKI